METVNSAKHPHHKSRKDPPRTFVLCGPGQGDFQLAHPQLFRQRTPSPLTFAGY